ncbi:MULTISPECIES: helix-turn-helix domain-containing protein [Actinoalloteichus]|uniref:DNA binding protein with helix-turn-helix domain n=1 Tax=Actinoalloteichus fjordicus TaxID=1612552 RepID=A0AAC9PU52_9PSEU|nr:MULTISPECIES: helix-turn-helix transcriptional regulator [Actinoalloteichus]APU16581.1 DNA binding protein with helix-turn-helix domain [Actinoalloteichus fjordicus]APU22647.1 DNA binding protein with helix-turn-helix domain [Actinoalloteichus sp. GBA129-24]
MNSGVSPTLRLWQVAESCKNYRDAAGLTIEEAADRLKPRSPRWSRSKIQRLETRLYAPQPAEIEQLTAGYGVPADEAAALVQMAREARQKGWWQTSAIPKKFQTFVGLEAAATEIRGFELALIPGLLQTSDYARALMSAIEPATPPDVLEHLVAARMVRQQVLLRPEPVKFSVILSESVLRCQVGGRRVMRGQLERLVEVVDELGVVLQIVPFSVGPHAGMEGSFMVLSLPDLASDVGYVDGTVGIVYLETSDDVRRCLMRFAALSSIALSPGDSLKMVSSALADYR